MAPQLFPDLQFVDRRMCLFFSSLRNKRYHIELLVNQIDIDVVVGYGNPLQNTKDAEIFFFTLNK